MIKKLMINNLKNQKKFQKCIEKVKPFLSAITLFSLKRKCAKQRGGMQLKTKTEKMTELKRII
jgi:hypothetical protein